MTQRDESAAWNPSPDEKMVKGIYNSLYARQRADSIRNGKPSAAPARKSGRRPAAASTEVVPVPIGRAQTNDAAPPVTAAMRVDAVRGMVGLYNHGFISPENLLRVVVDIATERGP